jgi:dolichol-phosphate mannosyltransferase
MKTVDLVLPVYNEQEGIEAFHGAMTAVLAPLAESYTFQFIYVLDRCTDNSFGVLKELAANCPQIALIQLSSRFGHQMSLVAGIDYSRADVVIMMDCDMQHPPEAIPLLLQRYEEGFDVVHAIRSYGRDVGMFKKWMSRLFYVLQNKLSPVELPDGAADFRLISRKVATVFQTSIREQNQFLRGLFHWVGFRSSTVRFASKPRSKGSTKYDLPRLIAFSISGILAFSKVPLRLAALLGLGLSCVSILYGAWLVLTFFTRGDLPPGYTSSIVITLFLGGLQLTVLGVLGEYLSSVFNEAKNRPLYIIEEIVRATDR